MYRVTADKIEGIEFNRLVRDQSKALRLEHAWKHAGLKNVQIYDTAKKMFW